MKVLLVEDEEHVLRLERAVLIADGFEVETASGGRAALAKLQSTPYDGIVLDMQMPDLDGCEVTRQVRNIRANARTPVIMVTGRPEPAARQRAFDAGAVAFLTKPFTADGFRSAIRTAIAPAPGPAVPPRPAEPIPRPATDTPAPPSSAEPTPRPTRPPGGRAQRDVLVRSETGAIYACAPQPQGGWRCGRCEVGLLTAEGEVPVAGSRCSVCQAEVVEAGRRPGKRWWPF
jgi:CheY-like chemotaxis protein